MTEKLFGGLVTTDEEVEVMRVIRNDGREWMTEDTHEISIGEQRAWWEKSKQRAHKNFLPVFYRTGGNPTIVGYGVLDRRDNDLMVSLAVAPVYRGLGFGQQIYEHLAKLAGEEVTAVIRKDNAASIKAVTRAGYTLIASYEISNLVIYSKGR